MLCIKQMSIKDIKENEMKKVGGAKDVWGTSVRIWG